MTNWLISFLVLCAVENWGYIFFFDIFMKSRMVGNGRFLKYLMLYVPVIFTVILTTALFPAEGEVLKVPFLIFVMTAFCSLCYKVNFIQGAFFSAINYVLMLLIDLAVVCVLEYLNYSASPILMILIRTLWILVLIIMKRQLSGIKNYLYRDNISWIRFSWFSTISVIVGIYFYIYVLSHDEIQLFYSFISIGLAVLDIVALYFLQDFLIKDEKIRQSEIMLIKKQNQMRTFEDMKTMYERQGKKLHDYKKQLLTVSELIDSRNFEAAGSLTKGLAENISVEASEVNTGHPVVNAVLNQEYRIAKSKGIRIIFSVGSAEHIRLSDEDIVVVFGNLLENAIHECEKITEDGKNAAIQVKLSDMDGETVITIQNPVLLPVHIEDNAIVDRLPEGHGIGLVNVRETVEKYGGSFAISCDDREFTAVVII